MSSIAEETGSDPSEFLSSSPKTGAAQGLLNIKLAQRENLLPGPEMYQVGGIVIPPPSVYPKNLGPFLRLEYLADVFLEAVKWTALPDDSKAQKPDPATYKFQVRAELKKNPDKVAAICEAFEAIRDGPSESRMSPLFWAWWRLDYLLQKLPWEGRFPGPLSVFKPDSIQSPKIRAIFWREGMARAAEAQILWPLAAKDLLAQWREFEKDALDNPTMAPTDLAEVWDLAYKPKHNELRDLVRTQRFRVKSAVERAHERNDLGLWLAKDLVAHLRLRTLATTSLA